jgi:hypothetical protein
MRERISGSLYSLYSCSLTWLMHQWRLYADPVHALRIVDEQYRVAHTSALHALVNAGQKSAAPNAFTASGNLPPLVNTTNPGRF